MKSLNTLIGILILSGFISFGQDNSSVALPSPKTSTFSEVFPSMDIYAASTLKCGSWGFGAGFFAKPLSLSAIKKAYPVNLCLGVDAYFLQMQHRDLGSVPISNAQSGEADLTLSQTNFGVNTVARFLFTCTPKIKPYTDLFIGVRGFSSDANYKTTNDHNGKEENTSQNLSSEVHWNYGASVGILYSISKNTKLNFGIMFTSSEAYGGVANIKSAKYNNGVVVTEKMNTPKNTCIVKLGLSVEIRSRARKSLRDPSLSVNNSDLEPSTDVSKSESSENVADDYYVPTARDLNEIPKNTKKETLHKIDWNRIIVESVFQIMFGTVFNCGGSVGGGGVSK